MELFSPFPPHRFSNQFKQTTPAHLSDPDGAHRVPDPPSSCLSATAPACQQARATGGLGHARPRPGSRSFRSEEGSTKGPPASSPTQGKGKRDAPESLLATSGRRVLSLPIAAPSSALRCGVSGRVLESEVHPGAAATVPLWPAGPRSSWPAPRLHPPAPALSPRPSPQTASGTLAEPSRALAAFTRLRPLSPAPWYPGSRPSSRSPLAPAQVPMRAELRSLARPKPLERTLAPARNKEVGGAPPAPVPGRAAARSVPRGDGRSRQGSEQREQCAGGPVLLARGRARRRAPSRRHGQSPPPRPGRPVTWPPRPNNAARSRRAPGPVRLWDLPKLARWNRELLDPLSSPDSKCSGGWWVPDGQTIS